MIQPGETYLHDGLYASFDGFQIRLRAPRENGDHVVFLDWVTLTELLKFIAEIKRGSAEPTFEGIVVPTTRGE